MRKDFTFARLFKAPYRLDLVWFVLPAAMIAIGMAFMPARSWDYWWHISFGRMINHTHMMPQKAYFLYTIPADTSSYVQAWLSQWALFALHDSVSIYGMLLLRNGLSAGAFLILTFWAIRRSGSAMTGSIITLSVVPFGFFIIALRSHLLAWPLIFLVLPLAYRVKEGKMSPWFLAFFPLLTVLWVNLHGTFLVPVLIALSFFADGFIHLFLRKKEFNKSTFTAFGLTTVASIAATFLNPRGHEVYLYLIDLPTNIVNLTLVSEWFPTTPFFPEFYGSLFWILFLASLFFFWKNRKTLMFADAILLCGFSFLAMRHCRALMWFFLVFPIAVSAYVPKLNKDESNEVSGAQSLVNLLICLTLVFAALFLQPFTPFQREMIAQTEIMDVKKTGPLAGAVSSDFPFEMVEKIKSINPHARIFHDHRYAGYLIFALQSASPEQTLFVDNRIELSSPEIWNLLDEVSQGKHVEEVLNQYEIEFVLLKKASQKGLEQKLEGNLNWKKIAESRDNALFQRR